MKLKLSEETLLNLEYMLGTDISKFVELDLDDEIQHVEKKINKPLRYVKNRCSYHKLGRGNPLLARRRYRTMEDVDRGLSKIK